MTSCTTTLIADTIKDSDKKTKDTAGNVSRRIEQNITISPTTHPELEVPLLELPHYALHVSNVSRALNHRLDILWSPSDLWAQGLVKQGTEKPGSGTGETPRSGGFLMLQEFAYENTCQIDFEELVVVRLGSWKSSIIVVPVLVPFDAQACA